MREATFIAPVHDNNGNETTAAQWYVETALLDTFGGYTREYGVEGAWRSPEGRVYRDDSARYTVASDWTDESRAKLRAILGRFAYQASQESVYLRTDSGDVEFIAPTSIEAAPLPVAA